MSSRAIAAAYRVNWNPQLAPDDVTEADARKLEREGAVQFNWRCGGARIEPNQRIFLVRTGKGSRGIIGVRRAVSEPDGGREVDGSGNRTRSKSVFICSRFSRLLIGLP